MKLYVGNLSYSTNENTLREAFSNYGDVISVQIMYDRYTGQSMGFAFIEMGTDLQSERAIGGMNGKNIDGRRLRVDEAQDKPKPRDDSGRFSDDRRERRPREFNERRGNRDGDWRGGRGERFERRNRFDRDERDGRFNRGERWERFDRGERRERGDFHRRGSSADEY